MASSKDLRQLCRCAQRQGWSVSHTRGGHLAICPPDGGSPVIASGTPSDWRALRKVRLQLRSAGLDLP